MTLSGNMQANGLTFLSDNYVLTGGTLNTGSPTGGTLINVATGITATIASNIITAGGLGISKTGTGTLNLTGASVNLGAVTASTEALKVTGGTLNLSTRVAAASRSIAVDGVGSVMKINAGAAIYSGSYSNNGAGIQLRVRNGGLVDLQNWNYDDAAAGTRSLGGLRSSTDAILLNNGTIRISGTTATDYDRGFTIGAGGATLESATGADWTLGFNAATTLVVSGGGALNLTGAGTGRFNKTFTGTGKLTKAGAGVWTLGAANTHTGGTDITGGTLITAASSGALGTGAVTLAGGTLRPGAANITGIASLTVDSGTLDTSGGKITTTGAFSLFGGTWKIGAELDGLTVGSFAFTGGTIDLSSLIDKTTGANGFSLLSGTGTVSGLSFIGGDSGFDYALNTAGDLMVTAIPEPTSYGLMGAGAIAALAGARRRRNALR